MSLVLSGNSGSLTVDSSNGITFPNSTVQASAGSVIQVVSTNLNTAFQSTATSFTNITGLSASITPKFSTSKVMVIINIGNIGSTNGNTFVGFNLTRAGTSIGQGVAGSGNTQVGFVGSNIGSGLGDANSQYNSSFTYLDSPATTSSTTYQVQGAGFNSGGTWTINRSNNSGSAYNLIASSSITLLEIAQ